MRYLGVTLLVCLCAATPVSAAPQDFPRPPELEPAVDFWKRVYSQVGTDSGLLHDRYELSVVYEEINFDEDAHYRERTRRVSERRDHYREILNRIAASDRDALSGEAARVLALWPDDVSDKRLRRAAHDLRFQLGQSDKFRAGLIRSGEWEPYIRQTLYRMGLPEELAALPHVESSFNPDAYSRAGAAGIWQFTRATGKRYLRVDRVVDERMDPFRSTVAAAHLLDHNRAAIGSWPLAITAYNHGLRGVRRGVRQVGSRKITDLIEDYQHSQWGFASRNFYAAFLAAVEVDFNAVHYFGSLERRPVVLTEVVELPFYVEIDELTQVFDVSRGRLRNLNRSLRGPVWRGEKRVPRGFELRVPRNPGGPPACEVLAKIDSEDRYFAQIPDRFHRVRRGDTLGEIASMYGIGVRRLAALNNLRSADRIRAGQRLRLPLPAGPDRIAEGDGEGEGEGEGDGTYTVRRGDTLGSIARRVGMSVASLSAANGLEDPSRIYPGQELQVDGSAAPGVTTLAESGDDTGP